MDENEIREAALEASRGVEPPQGAAGGPQHEIARPSRESLEIYAEANDIPIIDGVVNPRLYSRRETVDDDFAGRAGPFA